MSRPFHLRQKALTFLLAAATLPSTLALLSPSPREYCVWACNEATSYVTFEGSEELDYYTNLCSSELFLESFAYCVHTYCTEEETQSGLKLQNNVCAANAGLSLPDFDQYDLSESHLATVAEADVDLITESAEAPLDYAVVVSRDWYEVAYRTTAANFKNRDLAYDFVWAMYGFWGLVVLIGLINRCTVLLIARRHESGRYRTESNSMRLWIRKHLLLPATFGQHCQDPIGWCTIPPRLESILLVSYLIMNIVFLFPGYDLFAENIWYPTYQLQLSRYIGDRAGLMAIAQLPLAWIFATRNDPLLWLTGWSFATYNRFHRWVARLCMVLAIVHSSSYSIYTWKAGPGLYAESWHDEYFYCGAITIITMSLMIATSVYIFRARKYDLFLILHIVLAVGILVAVYYHVKVYEGEHNGFIYCCVAIWAFDRFMRLARTINLGLIPRFFKGIKATATYDDAADIIRLDVTDLLSPKTITPGHYYYLYAPGDIQGYQSHPFTLCSWRRAIGSSTQNSPITTATEDDKHSQPTTRSSSSSSSSSSDVVHSLLIRPYRGFTGRLQKKLSKSPDPTTSTQLTVFLEGPYGNALDLRSFSDVLIIVGGSGITAAISHSNFLLPTQQTSVHVVWAVQHSHLVDNICENELKEALNDAKLDLVVYETRKASADVEKMAPSKASRPVIHGRPDIGAVIREAREKCGRNLAVVTCGPPRLADACRAAVVDVLGEKGPGVEFYNEALGW